MTRDTPACTVCGRTSNLRPTCADGVYICRVCDKRISRQSSFTEVRSGLRQVRLDWTADAAGKDGGR